MQDLKRWHMAKPFRWRLPSYSGYWLPERGEGKNFTGHVPLRYLKVMKLDNRGEGAELHWPMKRIFSDFPHQKVYPYSCWYAGLETSLPSTWTWTTNLKKTEKWKCLSLFKIWGTWAWRRQKSESVKIYLNFGGPVQLTWKLSRAYFCDSYYIINI